MAAPSVRDLISRWQGLRAQGHDVSPEELCAACPELLSEFQAHLDGLESMESLLGVGTDKAAAEPFGDGALPGKGSADTATIAHAPSETDVGVAAGAKQCPAQTVAGYEILGELGRGGMGVVYKARQLRLNRVVALKMILAGSHAGPRDLERFRTEAEAVARLQHPNIVQIFEVGEHDARPFFSLEYVDGGSLDRKLVGTPLPAREAARLVELLARAMDAAHQRGIIHRDLKPANILLATNDQPSSVTKTSEKPPRLAADSCLLSATPKITDFGLAKRLDAEAGQTQTGDVMGTPSYMAPEQAKGKIREVGPATDVYALGAILYECLTGRPPFRAATVYDTIAQVLDEEPVPPRRLQSKTPRDLETISLKCLAKDPAKRYGSAEALAEDLERFLEDRPVRARRISGPERLWRWAYRRPAQALAALCLIIAVVAFGWWYQHHQAQRQLRIGQREQAIQAALTTALRSVDDLRSRLAAPGGVFKLLNRPADWQLSLSVAREAIRHAEELEAAAEEPVAEDLAGQIRQLANEVERDEADRRLALRLERIREDRFAVVDNSFNYRQSARDYPKAFEQAGLAVVPGQQADLIGRVRQSRIRDELLAALDDWVLVASQEGRESKLWPLLLEIARGCDPDPWMARLRDPAVRHARKALEHLVSEASTDRALLQRLAPQTLLVIGLLLREQSGDPEPWFRQVQTLHPQDFWLAHQLGYTLLIRAKPEQAEAFLRAALSIRPESAASWLNVGLALAARGDLKQATEYYRRALAIDPYYPAAWNNLGSVASRQGDLKTAAEHFRKAIELNPNYAKAWHNLGKVHYDHKDLKNATVHFKKAVELDPDDADAHNSFGSVLDDQGDTKHAAEHLERALSLKPKLATAWHHLGIVRFHQRNLSEAAACFQRAVDTDPQHGQAWFNLGISYAMRGDLTTAETHFRQALRVAPRYADASYNIARVLRARGDLKGAAAYFKKTVELNSKFSTAWIDLATVRANTGDHVAAVEACRQAIAVNESNPQPRLVMGVALLKLGDWQKAADTFEQAERLFASQDPGKAEAQRFLKKVRHLLALDKRLPAVLQGDSANSSERLELAAFCLSSKKRYRDAVQLFAAAIPDRPQSVAGRSAERYNGACAAALAIAGKEHAARPLSDLEKQTFTDRARGWLATELKAWQAELKAHPQAAAEVFSQMDHWQRDPDLASVRSEQAVSRLPGPLQQPWRQLWTDVDRLRRRAMAAAKETRFIGALTQSRPQRAYEVSLHAGRTYVIDMVSTDFDPFLRLEDAGARKVQENDDAQPGVDQNARLLFTPGQDAQYRLVAILFADRGEGAYEIVIREFPGRSDTPATPQRRDNP